MVQRKLLLPAEPFVPPSNNREKIDRTFPNLPRLAEAVDLLELRFKENGPMVMPIPGGRARRRGWKDNKRDVMGRAGLSLMVDFQRLAKYRHRSSSAQIW